MSKRTTFPGIRIPNWKNRCLKMEMEAKSNFAPLTEGDLDCLQVKFWLNVTVSRSHGSCARLVLYFYPCKIESSGISMKEVKIHPSPLDFCWIGNLRWCYNGRPGQALLIGSDEMSSPIIGRFLFYKGPIRENIPKHICTLIRIHHKGHPTKSTKRVKNSDGSSTISLLQFMFKQNQSQHHQLN